jgi:hypothetical protein
LEYLAGNCQLQPLNEENPAQIAFDLDTIKTIMDHLKARKSTLSYQYKRVISKIPYTKGKTKRKLQLADIRRIKDFSTWSWQNENLRASIINRGNVNVLAGNVTHRNFFNYKKIIKSPFLTSRAKTQNPLLFLS